MLQTAKGGRNEYNYQPTISVYKITYLTNSLRKFKTYHKLVPF